MILKLVVVFVFLNNVLGSVANPFTTPIGEEEAFTSNTGVARHKSLGAFFYNPGALSTIDRSSFSLSGSLYSYYSYELDTGVEVGDARGTINGSGFSAIPGTFIISKKIKKGNLAFGILKPSDFKTESKENWRGANSSIGGMTSAEGILRTESGETWAGISYSTKVDDKIGVGVSVFGINHYNNTLGFVNQLYDDDSTKVRSSLTRQTLDSYGVLAILGAYYHERNYSLGVSLKTPSFTIYDKAEYYRTISDNISGTMQTTKTDLTDVESNFYRPADLSLGYSSRLNDTYTISLDISIQMPVKFTYLKTNDVETEGKVETKLTPRFNSGLTVRHSEKFMSLYGVSYNPSTIKNQSRNKLNSEADAYVVSTGFIMTDNNLSTGLGVNFLYGEGVSKFAGGYDNAKLTIYNAGIQLLSGYNF
jgi:long-subunit fatty acid transport protein